MGRSSFPQPEDTVPASYHLGSCYQYWTLNRCSSCGLLDQHQCDHSGLANHQRQWSANSPIALSQNGRIQSAVCQNQINGLNGLTAQRDSLRKQVATEQQSITTTQKQID